ncbi:MAG: methyltransferase domain-containing protein [Candidatus Shapirobacteria bacterium]
MVKVNLGCGPSGVENWINFDWGILPVSSKLVGLRSLAVKMGWLKNSYNVGWPEIKLADIRKKLPLRDGSVDWIYCSHVLEHLDYWQVEDVLKECFRVLKKDGRIRIVVPDLDKLIAKYEKNKDANLFCGEFFGFEKNRRPRGFLEKFSRRFIRPHEWLFNQQSLKDLIKGAGFQDISISDYRKSDMPEVERLDLTEHRELSCYLEACRG